MSYQDAIRDQVDRVLAQSERVPLSRDVRQDVRGNEAGAAKAGSDGEVRTSVRMSPLMTTGAVMLAKRTVQRQNQQLIRLRAVLYSFIIVCGYLFSAAAPGKSSVRKG